MRNPVDKKELRTILADYFSGKNTKTIVILSKLRSGRTTLINKVAEENNVKDKLAICSILSSGPVERREKTFDEYVDEKIASIGTDNQYCVVELTADVFLDVPKERLFGNGIMTPFAPNKRYLSDFHSEKYDIVPYFPTIEDWVEWAENKEIEPIVISFAKNNPLLYEVGDSYGLVYGSINEKLVSIKGSINPNEEKKKFYETFGLLYSKPYTPEWKEENKKELLRLYRQMSIPNICERYLAKHGLDRFLECAKEDKTIGSYFF